MAGAQPCPGDGADEDARGERALDHYEKNTDITDGVLVIATAAALLRLAGVKPTPTHPPSRQPSHRRHCRAGGRRLSRVLATRGQGLVARPRS